MTTFAICFLASGVVACRSPEDPGPHRPEAPSEWTFITSDSVSLQEKADEVIGDIGQMVVAGNGDYLITDPIRSEVRRYSSTGTLLARFGRYGEGPEEFGRVASIVEDAQGRVVVPDPRRNRIVRLTAGLRPDTIITPPVRLLGASVRVGTAVALMTTSAKRVGPLDRRAFLSPMTPDWLPEWSIPAPSPGTIQEFPYWDSYATLPTAGSQRWLVIAYSLRYPLYIYSAAGLLLDSIAAAPRAFRAARVVQPGEFASADGVSRIREWLESFDVIARVDILGDTLLAVTHGVMSDGPTGANVVAHRTVDLYRLPSGDALASGLRLPIGSRVLSGGTALRVLTAVPPAGWTITNLVPHQRNTPTSVVR